MYIEIQIYLVRQHNMSTVCYTKCAYLKSDHTMIVHLINLSTTIRQQCMCSVPSGNSWGVDAETGEGCVGCGPQEEFYACADVKISEQGGTVSMPTTTTTTSTAAPTPVTNIVCPDDTYVASDTYAADPNMTPWCQNTCPTGYCPSSHCQCGTV